MDDRSDSTAGGEAQGCVALRNSEGIVAQGLLRHFTPCSAVFEFHGPSPVVRTSEVLADFKIIVDSRSIYSGKAVVSKQVDTGTALVIEVALDSGWIETATAPSSLEEQLSQGFAGFLRRWQKTYTILPEFKSVIADIRSLLTDLRLWLDQIETRIRSDGAQIRTEREVEAARLLAEPVLKVIDTFGDRFEEIAGRMESRLRPAHILFARRNLHSLVLCSPFAYRTFHKPLGYAGDYEMINMITRNPYEGETLFSKIINAWFLNQLPAQAHRQRLMLLKERLTGEIARISRKGSIARIFNLGCGPAGEIQTLLAESPLADHAHFELLDFNEETIQYTGSLLQKIGADHRRRTAIQLRKQSVQQLLKEAWRQNGQSQEKRYDFLYCAGLFDYLPERICKDLTELLYRWLAPGGLLLVTNVDGTRPFRNKLEFILDWNLIYRTGREIAALAPDAAAPDDCSVIADTTSVNVFLEVRKPDHA